MSPRILVVAGDPDAGSPAARLAGEAARCLARADATVTTLSLSDYVLPIFVGQTEAIPQNALLLARRLAAQDGLLIATPEYNGSVPPLLKNAIDWIGCVRRADERPVAPFARLVAGVAGASDGPGGARNATAHLADILRHLGCDIVGPRFQLEDAGGAFERSGELAAAPDRAGLDRLVERLVEHGRALGRHGADDHWQAG